MIDLRRLGALLGASAMVGGPLVGLDLIARATRVLHDPILLRAEHADPARRAALGSRVSAVEAAPLGTTQLGVVIGFSTAREGLVPEILASNVPTSTAACMPAVHVATSTPAAWRWLNLAGSGGSFFELPPEIEPLIASDLRPARVILAIHASWLAGRVDDRLTTIDGPSWLWARKAALRQTLERVLAGAQSRARAALGEPLSSLHPRAERPFDVKTYYRGRAAPEHLARQWDAWTHYGWFSSAHYAGPDADLEAEALVSVVQSLARHTPELWVVLLPEPRRLRDAVPDTAMTRLRHALDDAGVHHRLLDLRAEVPDRLFHDHAHLDECGRVVLSEKVRRLLSPTIR